MEAEKKEEEKGERGTRGDVRRRGAGRGSGRRPLQVVKSIFAFSTSLSGAGSRKVGKAYREADMDGRG